MKAKSVKRRLSIRSILKFWERSHASLIFEFFHRVPPHFDVLSISMHNCKSGIKKSMMYRPIGFCISKPIFFFDIISRNRSSCGHNFLRYVTALLSAIFAASFSSCIGFLFFNLRLAKAYARQSFFVRPQAQCFSRRVSRMLIDSLWSRSFSPSTLHKCMSDCRTTPAFLARLRIGVLSRQWFSDMMRASGFLKCASI